MILALWVALIAGFVISQFGIILFLADRLLKVRADVADLRALVMQHDEENAESFEKLRERVEGNYLP